MLPGPFPNDLEVTHGQERDCRGACGERKWSRGFSTSCGQVFFLSLWVLWSGPWTAWVIVHLDSHCAKDDRAKLTPQWRGQASNEASLTFRFAYYAEWISSRDSYNCGKSWMISRNVMAALKKNLKTVALRKKKCNKNTGLFYARKKSKTQTSVSI